MASWEFQGVECDEWREAEFEDGTEKLRYFSRYGLQEFEVENKDPLTTDQLQSALKENLREGVGGVKREKKGGIQMVPLEDQALSNAQASSRGDSFD